MGQPFTKRNTRAAKLTGEQVVNMRLRYARGGVSQPELAREHHVSLNTIARALNGLTWAGLPMPVTEDEARASQTRFMQRMGIPETGTPTVTEQRAETAALSLEELMKRDALDDEGRGKGLNKLHGVADRVLAPDRMVEELLKKV